MQDSLEELKKHPSVLRLYQERVRLKRNGKEMEGICPLHPDKNPSFKIRQAPDGTYLWNCFGCDAKGGNIFQFIEKKDQVPFNKAVEIVRQYVEESWTNAREKVNQTFKPFGDPESKIKKVYSIEEYGRMESALHSNPIALGWLAQERGISKETAQKLHLGYRQDVGKLAGDTNADVADKGWVVFPTFDGRYVTSLKYRSICQKSFCKQGGMGTFMWNTQTVDFLEPIFLCEGEIDSCTFEQMGYRSVSLPSAQYKPTPADKDLLLSAECVILAGDSDPTGSEAMNRLWQELEERTYLLRWPDGVKDCNQFWIEVCKRDPVQFRTKIETLIQEAKSRPMAGIRSLPEMMVTQGAENVLDDPNRFRFPWKSVDDMAVISPGSVVGLVATNSGQGKSTWVLQATLEAARRHGETVLNYQAELTEEQVARIVTAHMLRKHRLQLNQDDFKQASQMLSGVKYYIGRNPVLNTIEPVLDLIEAGIRRLSPTVVVLDNLHFLARFDQDQVKAVENAMQRIKNLASTFKLKFFVVGQPKKADSTQKGKALHITDVRGSAAFGDDSDVVFALHRDMIKSTDDDKKNDYRPECRVRLVKVRDKGLGDSEVDLIFLGELASFSEIARLPEGNLDFGS